MKIFSTSKGGQQILSDLFGDPIKFSGFDRGATKIFYKDLKFSRVPPRWHFMTDPLRYEKYFLKELSKLSQASMVRIFYLSDSSEWKVVSMAP